MKNWKSFLVGLLVICLLPVFPYAAVSAEEEQETEYEEPIPESYYYEIESNEIENWPQGPAIEAASAVVMDMDTGVLLYSKQATSKQYPASITKIMTTLLLVENCDLDEEITFSEIVYDLEEGSSHLGIQPGETMTLRDAAYGIMLASANDISNGVAEYMGGSIGGFADMMNEKAEELGCVNTHFANPHGLHSEDHYTCAYDMALIAKAAYDNPVFREIVGTKEYSIPETNLVDEARSFLNHHKMLQQDQSYYREWCTGGKTGFTSDSLNTLVTYGEQDGSRLVSVLLRVNGVEKQYTESTEILEYAFENFTTEKYETGSTEQTFYDIMRLGYLGDAGRFQSPVPDRSPRSAGSICRTVPTTASAEDLEYEITESGGSGMTISYEYNGCVVGSAYGVFHTLYAPAQLVFERDVELAADVSSTAAGDSIQIEGFDDVLVQAAEIFDAGYHAVKGYTEENPWKVLIGGAILLVILLIFITVLIFRSTANYRIQRRRKQEEQERRRREEEIERMTTAEIEAELRAVMNEERLRREQKMQEEAEAERAAAIAREEEEKSREVENLLNELEQERRESIASKK